MERNFKGIWIPKEIWLNNNLTLQEKAFLVEIDSLDNDEGCYATNEYFSKFFNLSKNRCSEVIKSLEKKEMIVITYIRGNNGKKNIEKRIIKLVEKSNTPIRKIDRATREIEEGYSENCEENNTIFNNTNNNTNNIYNENELKGLSEKLFSLYPRCGNKLKSINKISNLIKDIGYEHLERCIKRYLEHIDIIRNNGFNQQYLNSFTFFSGNRYLDYKDDTYEKTMIADVQYKTNKSKSTFNNYKQRSYDFKELERQLLGWNKGV